MSAALVTDEARLRIGMSGYHDCIAAELLKHTDAGWPEVKQAQFATMLREIWYPVILLALEPSIQSGVRPQ